MQLARLAGLCAALLLAVSVAAESVSGDVGICVEEEEEGGGQQRVGGGFWDRGWWWWKLPGLLFVSHSRWRS